VALKKLKGKDPASFLNEAAVLQKLKNSPNIVQVQLLFIVLNNQILGVHVDSTGNNYIVMEYFPLGSLRNLLLNNNNFKPFDLVGM
jgi:serine/threonine protein kinase